MDGANLNAMVGISKPGHFGPDLCHINLHKTFCIPHGGGGPGVGPIAVKKHLSNFIPNHPLIVMQALSLGLVLCHHLLGKAHFDFAYFTDVYYMMGSTGIKKSTQVAILNANYVAKKIEDYFPILYIHEEMVELLMNV